MTLLPSGGAAIPVSVDTTRAVQGGSAIPVYGYTTAPTDGRPALAGPALPVRVLTAADLKQNGGQWTVEGRPYAMPVYTAPTTAKVAGGAALAVYPVNAWPTVAPVATPWYLSGGIAASACVAAYQPKGAASLAASYSNLANPGTNNAAAGVAPTWDATNGWKFDAISQYLVGPTVTATNATLVIRFSNLVDDQLSMLGGVWMGMDIGFDQRVGFKRLYCGYGNSLQTNAQASQASGVLAVAKSGAYLDGTLIGSSYAVDANLSNSILWIGDINGDHYIASGRYIQAYAVYNVQVTEAQITALTTAMAAL